VPLTGLMQRVFALRTNAQQLAAARILVAVAAALAAFEAWRMLSRLLRPLILRVPLLPGLPALPSSALAGFIAVWLAAALAFALGWRTRVAGAVLTLVAAYTLFLDQQTYSNHLYLLVVVLLLLTISDSGAAGSLDARRHRPAGEVAGWPVLLLKIQVSIVYLFSALAKITPRYLTGDMLAVSLKEEGWPVLPAAWRTSSTMSALAWASIVVEIFIAFGLWSSRVRPFAIVAGIGFHILILAIVDSSRLSLLIFALPMFAAYLLFADAELLERLKSRVLRRA
jgi:hypothetical protein